MSCCVPKPTSDYHKFNANYRQKPITEKFWSPPDKRAKTTESSKILYYEQKLEKVRKHDARCHSKVPRYTNQTYGWLPGYKILFLQKCDLNICQTSALQKVAKDLLQQHLRDPKTLTNHCACKKLLEARDHWKIV
ncbi:uncharacterized protein LOC119605461 [Lucilia sericata]|uniref:uncharacterized protein LOC119605461 n=1 Tax=Lucilia sericata TaxID=13632 RepID=UPI0018A85EFA|nr:uncharacterized protein LOC119605461 [Lucilia sericata]